MDKGVKQKLLELQELVDGIVEDVPTNDNLTDNEFEIMSDIQNLKETLEQYQEVFND